MRLLQDDHLRTWSLLQEPPKRKGERRLAIERESLPGEAIHRGSFDEQAFGKGTVYVLDEGEVEVTPMSARHMNLVFGGIRLSGSYRLRRMPWYPGNHWLLEKQ